MRACGVVKKRKSPKRGKKKKPGFYEPESNNSLPSLTNNHSRKLMDATRAKRKGQISAYERTKFFLSKEEKSKLNLLHASPVKPALLPTEL